MNIGTQIFSIKGKTALITGATGHLGEAMSFILAEAGAHILVNSRSEGRCASLVKRLLDAGHSAESAVFDISNQDEVRRFFFQYGKRPLHIMINNAYSGGSGRIEGVDHSSYTESFSLTVIAAHNILQAGLDSLRLAIKETGDASIINIGTMYAIVSPDQRIYDEICGINPPYYGAAKAALLQWTRYAACEFGPVGIRVNSISPGPFPSIVIQQSNPVFVEQLNKKVPMGRVGSPDEIKGVTLFLASSASSYVNGSNIIVDGGWTCW